MQQPLRTHGTRKLFSLSLVPRTVRSFDSFVSRMIVVNQRWFNWLLVV